MSSEKDRFSFNAENLATANEIVRKYPPERQKSAVIPLLTMAQEQAGGWLPHSAIEYVADFLKIPYMRAYEVATFYTMFNLKPVGKHHIQVCSTTPCWLRGSDDIVAECKKQLGIDCGETTNDGKFTISEVECLGACVNAPVIQISNGDYFEDVTPAIMVELIEKMKNDQPLQKGSVVGRNGSEPKAQ